MAFRGFLKQSTAVTIKLGPFVDDADGNTEETALTISQADVRLSKNGGNYAQKNDATACTHDELGMYDCPLDATDTNTLGILDVTVHEAGALIVEQVYGVMPANVYDSFFSTDKLQVDAVELNSVAASAVNMERSASIIVTGQAQTGTLSTTQMTTNLTEATNDHYNGRRIIWTSGALLGQATDITDYSGASGLLTFTAVTEAPINGDTFVIV